LTVNMLGWTTLGQADRRYYSPAKESPRVTGSGSRLHELTDEELMVRYVRNEVEAFEVLFARYRQPLFSFLYRYLGRPDKAEDVFQEVFFEVIRARKSFRPEAKFSYWLFRIARNRAVDRLRRNGFREMESLDVPTNLHEPESSSKLNQLPGESPDPETLAQDREIAVALQDAMDGLPSEQREVFWLKEMSGLTLSEIADLTGVSENTVKSRLRYALSKLRSVLSLKGFEP